MNLNGRVRVAFVKPPGTVKPRVGEEKIIQVIRFVRWMESRRFMASAADVVTHFSVSRATAYRWLRGYEFAKGVDDVR